MKTLNLSGIPQGDSLHISVSQGALSAGPQTVAAWGGGGAGGTVAITTNRTMLWVAPDSVRFKVDLSGATFDTAGPVGAEIYDARMHDLIYLWDFDDAASGAWSAPENVLPAWKNRTIAKGPYVSHIYTRPGTYTPSVLIVEPSSGKTATASVQVIVADPDAVYAGADTICVNPAGDGDFTGAPAGAARENIDFITESDPRWNSHRDGTPKRWLYKRGASYDQALNINGETPGLYFGAYGTGAKPVINAVPDADFRKAIVYCHGQYGGGIVPTAPDLRYAGLHFQGDFDATREWSNQLNPGITLGLIHQGNLDLVVSDCRFDGFHSANCTQQPGQKENPSHFHMDDSVFTNFGGQYPIYMAGCAELTASFSATGCRIAQVPDAIDNDATNTAGSRSPIRLTSCPNVHLRGCDFYHTDHDHASLRISGTVEADGYVANVHSCAFEGGFGAITMYGSIGEAGKGMGRATVQHSIIDGCIWVGMYCGETFLQCSATGLTVRNCLAIMPAVDWLDGTSRPHLSFFKLKDAGGRVPYDPTIVGAAPVRIYNNTLICERAPGGNNGKVPAILDDETANPGFSNIVASNNILHMPDMAPAATAFAPLAADVLWTPRNPGRRDPDTLVLDTAQATPPDAVRSYRPLPGSAALGAALTGDVSYMDIALRDRPEPPSIGTWEAD